MGQKIYPNILFSRMMENLSSFHTASEIYFPKKTNKRAVDPEPQKSPKN